VIVLSSDDYCDVPTFQPTVGVQRAYPDHAPMLGLQELMTNYVWPRVLAWRAQWEGVDSRPAQPSQGDIDAALDAERQLIRSARAAGVRVIIAQHLRRRNWAGTRCRDMPRLPASRESWMWIWFNWGLPLSRRRKRAGRYTGMGCIPRRRASK
jgi:hypothetical protein